MEHPRTSWSLAFPSVSRPDNSSGVNADNWSRSRAFPTVKSPFHDRKSDIEQPLPGRNSIYLAYFLPKELENFSSEVCEALNERFDVSVHR